MKQTAQETDFLTREPGEIELTIEEEEKFIKNKRENSREVFLKAQLNGKIVGTLGFSAEKNKRYRHKGEFGMAVLEEYWGYGIGSSLLKVLLDWADKNGYVKISLKVDATNERAIQLYKKMGFKQEGILEKNKYIKNDEYRDEIVMALLNENNL